MWPAPNPRDCLARVESTTYAWGWAALCACFLDHGTYGNREAAREAAHTFAVRCALAQRRMANTRRARR